MLLVEDDAALRDLLGAELGEAGLSVTTAADGETAWQLLENGAFSLVLSDVRLPGMDGMALLDRTRSLPVPPAFILLTAFGSIDQAVAALGRGADDFLTKPVDLDHLRARVARVLHTRDLHRELARYREILHDAGLHGLIGQSPAMQVLFDGIRRIAAASGAVLVTGESGSGKELVARAIHRESPRRERRFVAVNCAGIPADLLESELFGHAAGSFSGATGARRGLFAEAEGGTLLLDEIGEMPPAMQAKLLRALQDGRVRPVGAERERSVDVRVIAATHRDPEQQVRDGVLREDLYYRLDAFRLPVPPLRERDDDIDLLAMHFLRRYASAMDRAVSGLDTAATRCLRAHPFPGNVRELANVIERAVTYCRGDRIGEQDLPVRLRGAVPAAASADEVLLRGDERLPSLAEIERRYIRHVLERVDGNKRRTAEILGIGRRTLYRRLGERDGNA